MSFDQASGRALTPDEEAIASAAFDRVRTQVEGNPEGTTEASGRFAAAVAALITGGASVASIARLERMGVQRAKDELGRDLLRAVSQASRRKKEAEATYNAAVEKAGRLLTHREIGEAAGVHYSTIRSMLSRPVPAEHEGSDPDQHEDNERRQDGEQSF